MATNPRFWLWCPEYWFWSSKTWTSLEVCLEVTRKTWDVPTGLRNYSRAFALSCWIVSNTIRLAEKCTGNKMYVLPYSRFFVGNVFYFYNVKCVTLEMQAKNACKFGPCFPILTTIRICRQILLNVSSVTIYECSSSVLGVLHRTEKQTSFLTGAFLRILVRIRQ